MNAGTMVNGIRVLDWSDPEVQAFIREKAGLPASFDLDYDQMYVAHTVSAIVVGELAHFTYRTEQLHRNNLCRQRAGAFIRKTGHRILGEPWKLSSD